MPREIYRRTQCKNCGDDMVTQTIGRPRKFCGDACRKQYSDRTRRSKELPGSDFHPEQLRKTAVEIAKNELPDEIRDTMRAEVRASISQVVKDQVMASVEVMTQMLPLAMAQMLKDLQSESWVERKTAYQTLLKYAMMFGPDEKADVDLSQINVHIGVPMPGEQDQEGVVVFEDGLEDFEREWPECRTCHQRRHPEAGIHDDKGYQCNTCAARESYQE